MPNWSESMEQTYEFYIVDPGTWKDKAPLRNVKSCTITRDLEAETLGSATIDVSESISECYVRIYLVTIQNGIKEKHPLGTFLVQSPSTSFDGKIRSVSMDAYTPLIELKEKQPPLGYYVEEGQIAMDIAYRLARENMRAPVVAPVISDNDNKKLDYDLPTDPSDTWMLFLGDLVRSVNYEFALDELGRVMFAPIQDIKSLQPVWTYSDDNSSILLPELDIERDMYGIPNVVEVLYSNGNVSYYKRVVNDDPDSPISTISRGREIIHRITDVEFPAEANQEMIDEYAEQFLRNVSSLEYTVTYTHGYCPVRIGDCVRLNYKRAGLSDVKAKVISQTIRCESGCQVQEKAVFTTNLWR